MPKQILFTLIASCLLLGCTENQRAKNFGGSATVNLKPGQKVVSASFKGEDLWILTRKSKSSETPETYELVEDSSFGFLQGKVIINEK